MQSPHRDALPVSSFGGFRKVNVGPEDNCYIEFSLQVFLSQPSQLILKIIQILLFQLIG